MNHTIAVNRVQLNVRERGAGDRTLVFLHFFGGSSRSWLEVIARLESDFRCIAPDLRGFGDSDAPTRGPSVDDDADDLAALIKELNIDRFVLVGHSMGGKIALALAARQPTGLEGLVLLAPSPPSPEPMADKERAYLLSGFGERAAAEETLRRVTNVPLAPAVREQAIEDMLRASWPAWKAWLETGSRENICDQMKRIEVPVLVVAGECDRTMTPHLLEREVVARLPDACLHVVFGAAHLLPLEAPEPVAALIKSEVARLINGVAD